MDETRHVVDTYKTSWMSIIINTLFLLSNIHCNDKYMIIFDLCLWQVTAVHHCILSYTRRILSLDIQLK